LGVQGLSFLFFFVHQGTAFTQKQSDPPIELVDVLVGIVYVVFVYHHHHHHHHHT
jgi:hypothetical protein